MNPQVLVFLPILIPILFGALSVLLYRSLLAQRILAVAGTGAALLASLLLLHSAHTAGIVALTVGGWSAPFGITIVADRFGALMTVMTGLMGFTAVLFSLGAASEREERFGYYPLIQILMMGVNGAFLTGDIFNLYVWFEVLLVASFALLVLGGRKDQLEGAVKYVVINLVASVIFLMALAMTYGTLGTLNMAHLAERVASADSTVTTIIAMLYMVAFAVKAGAFPLFFWLPSSYHTPAVAVSALFAGLLTKVGVYTLFRVFTLIFVNDVGFTHTILLWMGGMTMLTGVLGAAAQFEFRRILSSHIISQIGYMLMALGLLSSPSISQETALLAIAGGIFYIVQHIIVKTNLFYASGVAHRLLGSFELRDLGGLYRAKPFFAALFFIPALSLAGLPPLSGFFAKFSVIRAGVQASEMVLVAIALITGGLTLYSMLKIWLYAFWRPVPEGNPKAASLDEPFDSKVQLMLLPIVILAVCTLLLGVWGQPFLNVAMAAAQEMLDPSQYIQAVGLSTEVLYNAPGQGGL